MSALDVLRQIKQARRANQSKVKIVEWGNAEYINSIGLDNLTRKELRNHLEARDLDTNGTRLELLERLRGSLVDEQLHKFAYVETLDTEQAIEADLEERGSVYVAGSNLRGQLGVGDKEPRRYFTVVRPLRGIGVIFVTSSADMCYAVTEEHDVYVWGGAGVGRTALNMNLMKKSVTDNAVINNWMEPQIVADLAGEEVSGERSPTPGRNCTPLVLLCTRFVGTLFGRAHIDPSIVSRSDIDRLLALGRCRSRRRLLRLGRRRRGAAGTRQAGEQAAGQHQQQLPLGDAGVRGGQPHRRAD
jgi:hypothetical protein